MREMEELTMETNEIRNLRHEIAGLRQDLNKLLDLLGNVTINQPITHEIKSSENLESAISSLLFDYKVPHHLKGYRYLKEAIRMEAEGNGLVTGMTKNVYPTIAKNNNDTSSRVERAIRHAVENAEYPFSYKPTNSEFIAFLAEKVSLGQGKIA